mmetsp:Transcript_10311/g.24757  ORF Transcript_10311/g.24757 Transcript_10311/m.24757 type:complete len:117 (-) Transcript_10311:480-830(-)
MQLSSPVCRAMNMTLDHDTVPVGVDSCTSATVCGIQQMFVGRLEPVTGIRLKGATKGSIPIVAHSPTTMEKRISISSRTPTLHHNSSPLSQSKAMDQAGTNAPNVWSTNTERQYLR